MYARADGNRPHTTVPDHMPSSHRRYADWTIERIRSQVACIGPMTEALIDLILQRRPHPEQGFRAVSASCGSPSPSAAIASKPAVAGAIEIGALSYRSVRSILDHKLDLQPTARTQHTLPLDHVNIRGPRYYH